MGDRKAIVFIVFQFLTVTILSVLVVLTFSWRDDYQKEAAAARSIPIWQYKVVAFGNEGHDRTGYEALKATSVTPTESFLTALGEEGWEIVASYLEVETAFPNFGNEKYVTGLQPNVRPQRVVFVLKRPVR